MISPRLHLIQHMLGRKASFSSTLQWVNSLLRLIREHNDLGPGSIGISVKKRRVPTEFFCLRHFLQIIVHVEIKCNIQGQLSWNK